MAPMEETMDLEHTSSSCWPVSLLAKQSEQAYFTAVLIRTVW